MFVCVCVTKKKKEQKKDGEKRISLAITRIMRKPAVPAGGWLAMAMTMCAAVHVFPASVQEGRGVGVGGLRCMNGPEQAKAKTQKSTT